MRPLLLLVLAPLGACVEYDLNFNTKGSGSLEDTGASGGGDCRRGPVGACQLRFAPVGGGVQGPVAAGDGRCHLGRRPAVVVGGLG